MMKPRNTKPTATALVTEGARPDKAIADLAALVSDLRTTMAAPYRLEHSKEGRVIGMSRVLPPAPPPAPEPPPTEAPAEKKTRRAAVLARGVATADGPKLLVRYADTGEVAFIAPSQVRAITPPPKPPGPKLPAQAPKADAAAPLEALTKMIGDLQAAVAAPTALSFTRDAKGAIVGATTARVGPPPPATPPVDTPPPPVQARETSKETRKETRAATNVHDGRLDRAILEGVKLALMTIAERGEEGARELAALVQKQTAGPEGSARPTPAGGPASSPAGAAVLNSRGAA